MRPTFNICVFCGSSLGTNPVYENIATTLGQSIAQRQIGLVYGGASIGLMGTIADKCLSLGGYVTGVLPQVLVPYEIAHPGLSSLKITSRVDSSFLLNVGNTNCSCMCVMFLIILQLC